MPVRRGPARLPDRQSGGVVRAGAYQPRVAVTKRAVVRRTAPARRAGEEVVRAATVQARRGSATPISTIAGKSR
ncbi:hypothetical protein ACW23B_02355 [Streptomyces albidoflavus]